MQDSKKTRDQLLEELTELHQRVVKLEAAEVEREQTEEWRESERKYRDLVDNSLVGIYRTNLEGKILYVNEALTKMLEFDSPEEMMSEGVLVRYKNRKDRERLLEILKELGRVDNFEFDLLTSKGESIKALLSAVLDQDIISGMIMDISGRKLAEESLRESEERYRSLFKNNHSVMLLVDPESAAIVDANPAACFFYGWSPEELTSKKITDINMLTSEQVFQEMKRAQAEERQHFFFRHRLANEEIRDVEVYSAPIRLHGKELLYSIIHDITERKRAEAGLRRYAERLKIFHEIDSAILAARSPQEIAEAALSQIRSLIPMLARASVAVFDAENEEVRILAVHTNGVTRIGTENLFSLEEFGIPEELYEGRTVIVEDILLHPHHSPVDQALLDEGVRSFINVPLLYQGELIGTLNFGAEEPDRFTQEYLEIAQEVAGQLAVAIKNARLFNSVTQQREELRALAGRLEEIEEAERRRLAQELHDSVGQNLTALGINLNVMSNLLPSETETGVRNRLDDCLNLVEETAERIRNVMAELRPSVLDDYGLVAALRWHAERFSERTGVATLVGEEELKGQLPPAVEAAIFRIAQEALTNIGKHARASQVTLQLQEVAGGVRFTVVDDGVGFDPKILRQPGGRPGWGLVTMRERATAMGGNLSVRSEPGKGTQVVVEVRE